MPDILEYTLAQVRGFLSASSRSEAARDARWLSMLAIGTRGQAEQVDATVQRLTDHAHLHSPR